MDMEHLHSICQNLVVRCTEFNQLHRFVSNIEKDECRLAFNVTVLMSDDDDDVTFIPIVMQKRD